MRFDSPSVAMSWLLNFCLFFVFFFFWIQSGVWAHAQIYDRMLPAGTIHLVTSSAMFWWNNRFYNSHQAEHPGIWGRSEPWHLLLPQTLHLPLSAWFQPLVLKWCGLQSEFWFILFLLSNGAPNSFRFWWIWSMALIKMGFFGLHILRSGKKYSVNKSFIH